MLSVSQFLSVPKWSHKAASIIQLSMKMVDTNRTEISFRFLLDNRAPKIAAISISTFVVLIFSPLYYSIICYQRCVTDNKRTLVIIIIIIIYYIWTDETLVKNFNVIINNVIIRLMRNCWTGCSSLNLLCMHRLHSFIVIGLFRTQCGHIKQCLL